MKNLKGRFFDHPIRKRLGPLLDQENALSEPKYIGKQLDEKEITAAWLICNMPNVNLLSPWTQSYDFDLQRQRCKNLQRNK
jgi:hypothetical protein